MPVKIRLQRHGKKGKPYYWIVAADSRAERDGKYLEKLGAYNPNTNPATIDLDVDGAVKWLQNGAQPTDTAKAILSYKGALLKKHLAGGVKKGALTEEQAEAKFNTWLEEKLSKVQAKEDGLHEPVSLHPVIDLNTCIKSAACVTACPEKTQFGRSAETAFRIR